MLWDPYGRSETCETVLVYMGAKTCDAFGTAALHKKGDPKGERERRPRGNLRRVRGYPDIIGPYCLETPD